jgi:hypothetical protein
MYKKKYFLGKIYGHSRQVSPASLTDVFACNCKRALVDESGMSRTQIGRHNGSETVTVLGTPCVIPPHNSNGIYLSYSKRIVS